MLENVKTEHEFVLFGGKRIKNIVELCKEIKQMPEETFRHHVTEQKNDFANWIEACTKEERLGQLIRTTKNRERMAAIIERRIKEHTRLPTVLQQPTLIRTRNVTLLNLSHKENASIQQAPFQKTVHHSPHKTILQLTHEPHTEIYVHEVNKHHHRAAVLISHLALGIVIGVAAAALAVMLNA
ncbi:MAG: hypothetical protein QW165_02995 [Candidatus Woesearchaeota archaeon]